MIEDCSYLHLVFEDSERRYECFSNLRFLKATYVSKIEPFLTELPHLLELNVCESNITYIPHVLLENTIIAIKQIQTRALLITCLELLTKCNDVWLNSHCYPIATTCMQHSRSMTFLTIL